MISGFSGRWEQPPGVSTRLGWGAGASPAPGKGLSRGERPSAPRRARGAPVRKVEVVKPPTGSKTCPSPKHFSASAKNKANAATNPASRTGSHPAKSCRSATEKAGGALEPTQGKTTTQQPFASPPAKQQFCCPPSARGAGFGAPTRVGRSAPPGAGAGGASPGTTTRILPWALQSRGELFEFPHPKAALRRFLFFSFFPPPTPNGNGSIWGFLPFSLGKR